MVGFDHDEEGLGAEGWFAGSGCSEDAQVIFLASSLDPDVLFVDSSCLLHLLNGQVVVLHSCASFSGLAFDWFHD